MGGKPGKAKASRKKSEKEDIYSSSFCFLPSSLPVRAQISEHHEKSNVAFF